MRLRKKKKKHTIRVKRKDKALEKEETVSWKK